MAYATSAPPFLQFQSIAGLRVWYHESADATATVDTASFITNGYDLGMKAGDVLIHKDTTTNATAMTIHKVVTVASSGGTAGVVDLSDGVVIGSATNTD